MGEEALHLDRGCIHGGYCIRISREAEHTASKGLGPIFCASCDVDWGLVAASSVDDAPTISSTTGSAWAEDLDIGLHWSTLAVERWLQRRGLEELHSMGRR